MIRTNVMPNSEYQEIMEAVLEFTSETLSHSLGPKGSNTLIEDKVMPFMTKDGATILRALEIEDPSINSILKLFKIISKKLTDTVGDASTTSMVASNAFYKRLKEINHDLSPKQVTSALRIIADIIENYARKNAIPLDINSPKVAEVAAISTNNDAELGQIIANAYRAVGKYGFVGYQLSKSDKTYFDIKSGFEINGTYCNVLMVNKPKDKECYFEKPLVVMFDDCVTDNDIDGIVKLMETQTLPNNIPLVIVATEYSDGFHRFVQQNLMPTGHSVPLKLLAIQVSRSTIEARDIFEDLSVFLDAGIFKKTEGIIFHEKNYHKIKLGTCASVTAGKNRTTFVGGLSNQDAVKDRIESITEELEAKLRLEANTSVKTSPEVFALRKRIAHLNDSMATIYVGAHTDFEKQVNMYLVEDAIFAVRSALLNGYNIGGSMYIPCLINKYGDEIVQECLEVISKEVPVKKELVSDFIDCITSAFLLSYKTVLGNAKELSEEKINSIATECIQNWCVYNILTKEFEDVNNANVINSVETDIEIMKTMNSIIGLMFTSNQMVTSFASRDYKNFGPSQLQAKQYILQNFDKVAPDRI